MRQASQSDLELLQHLINSGIVEKSAVTQVLEARKIAYGQAKQRLSGRSFLVDLEIQELQVVDLSRDQELVHLEFKESPYRPIQWERWGSERLVLDQDGHYQSSLHLSKQAQDLNYGLILTEHGSYVHTKQFLKDPWFAQTPTELCAQVHKTGSLHMPYDLTFSPDQQWLAISHRGSGFIQLISTQTYQTQFHLPIREAGSSSAINLSFDLRQGLLYATDNHSSSLFCIDLSSGRIEKKQLKLGQLGNLVLSADGDTLFLLALKPHEQLHCINTHNWQSAALIPLKGSLYKNNSNAPCDLLRLSPNQELLVVLTYQNAPRPFTPLLTVINAQTTKTLSRTALKDAREPLQLCFAQPNPLWILENTPISEDLIKAGLITELQLQQVTPTQVQMGKSATQLEAQEFSLPFTRPSSSELPQILIQTISNKELLDEPISQEAFQETPESAALESSTPHLQLPVFWQDFIVRLLSERFQIQHLIELDAEAIKTLSQLAPGFRIRLEHEAAIEVQINQLIQNHSLSTILRRRDLWLAQAKQVFLTSHSEPVPFECPQCHQKLMTSWDCQTCGLELESPERAFQNRIASKPAYAGLANGHFLLADPVHKRLIEVNAQREVVWELMGQALPCQYPIACASLPSQTILVADTQENQVFILDRQGKLQWCFNTFLSAAHQLKTPIAVKYYQSFELQADGQRQTESELTEPELRFLIVDQDNHRVLEVNLQNQILWSFGKNVQGGEDSLSLKHPTDIEYTFQQTYLITDSGNRRILEVNREGEIEQSWTSEDYPWTLPLFARRLNNGDILVLDDAEHQLYFISARGLVKNKIPYYKSGMPPEIKLTAPLSLQRLPNQNLIISSLRKALQILPVQKQLLWCLLLAQFKPIQKIDPIAAAEPSRVVQTAPLHSSPLQAQLAQKSLASEPPPRPQSADERLQALIDRRPSPGQNESYAHSVIYQQADAEVLNQSFYLLDQRHNGVVQVNRKGRVIWNYGYDLGETLAKPNFIQENDYSLLISDTHHNRVIEISKFEKELLLELQGPVDQPLHYPRSAQKLKNGNYLIADQGNQRLIELTPDNQVVWQYSDKNLIHSPYYAEALENGNILFVDSFLKRVLEINRQGHVQWYYGAPVTSKPVPTESILFGPTYATRLPNGNTLIADTYHHRVLEVNLNKTILWEYTGHASAGRVNPTSVRQLADGHLMITFFNHTTLVELKPDKSCVWSYTLGKDVFQAPVQNDEEIKVQHQRNVLRPFYNPFEKRQLNQAQAQGQEIIEIHLKLFDNVQMKSIRAQTILSCVEKVGMVVKTFPAPEDLFADRYGTELILACTLDAHADLDPLQKALANIAEVAHISIKPLII